MPSVLSTIAGRDQSRVRTLRIAVDIGGTFTDVAIFDEGSNTLYLGKSATQPRAMEDSPMELQSALTRREVLALGVGAG